LITVCGIAVLLLDPLLRLLNIPELPASIIYELFYGLGYTLSFMLPVLLLRYLLNKSSYSYISMRTSGVFSFWSLLAFFAGIALIYSASYINLGMVSFFDYSSFSSDYLWDNVTQATQPYEIVLQFILICVVPGFCEEFLFRGAILTNCLPFGRSNAILISAFLFAMMHQNPEQVFYTFVAGIVLGLLYERTGSIWPGTILHILNNFSSVMQGVVIETFGYGINGGLWSTVFEVVLFLFGILALSILIVRFFSRKNDLSNGIFEKKLSASDGYTAHPIAPKRAVSLFLTPSMIIFLILSILLMILLIGMAVLHGLFA
jgi:membrane protease YdiL (CAAX protease family)